MGQVCFMGTRWDQVREPRVGDLLVQTWRLHIHLWLPKYYYYFTLHANGKKNTINKCKHRASLCLCVCVIWYVHEYMNRFRRQNLIKTNNFLEAHPGKKYASILSPYSVALGQSIGPNAFAIVQ